MSDLLPAPRISLAPTRLEVWNLLTGVAEGTCSPEFARSAAASWPPPTDALLDEVRAGLRDSECERSRLDAWITRLDELLLAR